jgi:hypothetical protein
MDKAFPSCPIRTDWKALYRAAILETNRSVTPQRVAEAEKAVLARARELFYSHGTLEEKEALEDALYALRALKSNRQYPEAV